tara:strand:- start:1589 stop:3952 length:2364 start_codon:yes stop_codon:yes gene_type:complete
MSTIANLKINVIANTSKLRTGLKHATSRVKGFRQSIGKMAKRLALVGFAAATAGLYAIVKATRAVMKTFAEFEHAMAEVKSILIDTSREGMQPLIDQAKLLGETTVFSASEAAQAMAFLARAGFSSDEVMKAVPSTLHLAAAGNLELAEAADITSQVLRGMGLEAHQTARVANVLALTSARTNTTVSQLGAAFGYAGPVAAALGITLEETAAMLGVLSNAGMQADRSGTGLKNIMAELAAEIELNGISAIKKFTEGGIGVGQAFDIFQKRGGPAILALAKLSDRTSSLTDELNSAGDIAEEMAEARMNSLTGSFILLTSKIKALAIEIGERLNPTFRAMVEGFGKFTQAFTRAFDSMATTTNKAITSQENFAKTLADTFILMGKAVKLTEKYGALTRWLASGVEKLFLVTFFIMEGVISGLRIMVSLLTFNSGKINAAVQNAENRLDAYGTEFTRLAKRNERDWGIMTGSVKTYADELIDLGETTKKGIGAKPKDLPGVDMDAWRADPRVPLKLSMTRRIKLLEDIIKKERKMIGDVNRIYMAGNMSHQDWSNRVSGFERLITTLSEYRLELQKIENMKPGEKVNPEKFIDPEMVAAVGDATEDLKDFIKEGQVAFATQGLGKYQKTIEEILLANDKLKIGGDEGLSQRLIDEARLMAEKLKILDEELALTNKLENASIRLKKALETPQMAYKKQLEELQQMFGRGMINQFEFLEGLALADKELKDATKKDAVNTVAGIQTALGTVKVGTANPQQKVMSQQLSIQTQSNNHLKNINKKLQSSGGVII